MIEFKVKDPEKIYNQLIGFNTFQLGESTLQTRTASYMRYNLGNFQLMHPVDHMVVEIESNGESYHCETRFFGVYGAHKVLTDVSKKLENESTMRVSDGILFFSGSKSPQFSFNMLGSDSLQFNFGKNGTDKRYLKDLKDFKGDMSILQSALSLIVNAFYEDQTRDFEYSLYVNSTQRL